MRGSLQGGAGAKEVDRDKARGLAERRRGPGAVRERREAGGWGRVEVEVGVGVGDWRRPAGRGGGDRCSGLAGPSRGGKGDWRGGGAGRPKKPLRPPPSTTSKEALENWGDRAPRRRLEACGGGGLGPRERPSGSGATGVSVPHCGVGDKDGDG